MQKVSIIGRLVRDAAVRENGQTGNRFASFTVAVNTKSRGSDKTSYYDVLWNSYSERMVPYLTKGSAVCVGGDLDAGLETSSKDGKQYIRLNVFADYVQFTGITSSGSTQTTATAQAPVSEQAQPTVSTYPQPAPAPAAAPVASPVSTYSAPASVDDLPF